MESQTCTYSAYFKCDSCDSTLACHYLVCFELGLSSKPFSALACQAQLSHPPCSQVTQHALECYSWIAPHALAKAEHSKIIA